MPIEYRFLHGGCGVEIRGENKLTGVEFVSLKRDLASRISEMLDIEYWLVDLTDVTDLLMTTEDIRELVAIDREISATIPRCIVAVVAATDSAFGLARMWEMLVENVGWSTGVFRTAAEANSWVDSNRRRNIPAAVEQINVLS